MRHLALAFFFIAMAVGCKAQKAEPKAQDTGTKGLEASSTVPTEDAFKEHLDIWIFEVSLNAAIPKTSIIDINPHTRRIIREHTHRYPLATRDALKNEISLLLSIKSNQELKTYAEQQGVKVVSGAFSGGDVQIWIKLLEDYARKKSSSGGEGKKDP